MRIAFKTIVKKHIYFGFGLSSVGESSRNVNSFRAPRVERGVYPLKSNARSEEAQ